MADPQGQSPTPSVLATPAPVAPASDAPSLAVPASITAPDAPAGAPSSWFDELPDGLKSNPTLQNFKSKSVKDVAESLVQAEKLVGGSLRLPTDKDTPAEKAAKLEKVFNQLGRPEKAEGYKLEAPADSPIPWNQAQADQFKTVAHKLGLTQAQVDGLSEFDSQRAIAGQVDQTAAYNACMETLQKDWGAGSKQMLGLSRRTAATYFDKDTLAAIESSGLSNNPAFVKALASMGKELMEEGLIVGAREGMDEDGGITNLQAEIDRTMNDQKHAYWNVSDPAHEAAVIRVESLRRALLELTPSAR